MSDAPRGKNSYTLGRKGGNRRIESGGRVTSFTLLSTSKTIRLASSPASYLVWIFAAGRRKPLIVSGEKNRGATSRRTTAMESQQIWKQHLQQNVSQLNGLLGEFLLLFLLLLLLFLFLLLLLLLC